MRSLHADPFCKIIAKVIDKAPKTGMAPYEYYKLVYYHAIMNIFTSFVGRTRLNLRQTLGFRYTYEEINTTSLSLGYPSSRSICRGISFEHKEINLFGSVMFIGSWKTEDEHICTNKPFSCEINLSGCDPIFGLPSFTAHQPQVDINNYGSIYSYSTWLNQQVVCPRLHFWKCNNTFVGNLDDLHEKGHHKTRSFSKNNLTIWADSLRDTERVEYTYLGEHSTLSTLFQMISDNLDPNKYKIKETTTEEQQPKICPKCHDSNKIEVDCLCRGKYTYVNHDPDPNCKICLGTGREKIPCPKCHIN